MLLLFPLELSASLVLRVVQSGFKDLLDFAHLSLTLLFVVEVFVVAADHVSEQFHIVRRDHNVADFLLGLHFALVKEACLLGLGDYTAIDRLLDPLEVVIFQLICPLD